MMMVVGDGVMLDLCPVLFAMYGDRDRITAASSIFRMQSTLFWTPHHHRSLQSVPTMSQWVIQGILQKFTRIDNSVCLGWFMKMLHLSIFAIVSQSMADFCLPGCPVMTLCWLGVLNQFWLDQRPDALRTIQGAQISPGLHTSLTSPICYLRHKIGVKFRAVGENSSKTWMF